MCVFYITACICTCVFYANLSPAIHMCICSMHCKCKLLDHIHVHVRCRPIIFHCKVKLVQKATLFGEGGGGVELAGNTQPF